jgi:hypothetical protein
VRPALNDALRALIAFGARLLGALFTLRQRAAIRGYARERARLRRYLGVESDTPIRAWGPEVETAVAAAAPADARMASTSGSTSRPKLLPYDASRLRAVKLAYVDAFTRLYWALHIRRTSLYVFSSLEADASLTTLMLEEDGLPGFVATLQAPYRLQRHPELREIAREYGATALRLWMLTLANPGVLYATNPSTLAAFFDDLERDWTAATKLVRERSRVPAWITRRLASRGAEERLERAGRSDVPLGIDAWAPAVEAYVCWTGGWVKPFVERLAPRLPGRRLVPMYSMSTETLETTLAFDARGEPAFLPLAHGVLFELLPLEASDEPQHLVAPSAAEPGASYTLIASHRWGLTRYQTDDVFACERMVEGLPDLRFVRRRALSYSFTGEKLTSEQLESAYATARIIEPDLADVFITCVPSWPDGESAPHYRLVVLGDTMADLEFVARICEGRVREQNPEYAAKIASRRLEPMRIEGMEAPAFAELVGGAAWETQQKLLPLYRTRWEELGRR